MFGGVLQKQFIGVFTSFFAKIRENGDVAANDGLQRGTEISDDAARPHYDAAHNPKIPNNAVTGNFEIAEHITGSERMLSSPAWRGGGPTALPAVNRSAGPKERVRWYKHSSVMARLGKFIQGGTGMDDKKLLALAKKKAP